MATRTAASDRERATREAAERFVQLVRDLPQVRKVLLESRTSGPHIWTVIVAEPFDDAQRNPVYNAEMAVLRAVPSAYVGFRLVNLAEFPPSAHASLLPSDATVLLER